MEAIAWESMDWEEVTPQIKRKIVSGKQVMVAQIWLHKGTIVQEHTHLSEQITYVVEGALRFWLGGKELILRRGEVLVIPSGMPHKAEVLEDTLDIDMFSPIRQDWLDRTDDYLRSPGTRG